MVAEWIVTEYAKFQPWWDRKMVPAERIQRWDEFVKDLYRAQLLNWDMPEEEKAIDESGQPSDRIAYAKRMLRRLQDADSTVKNNIRLNRNLSAQTEKTTNSWNND